MGVSTVVSDAALKKKLIAEATATIELSERQACDVALLMFGGFSPLNGFMKQADYDGVVANMRLASGVLFSMPVVLDVPDTSLRGKKVLLKYKGVNMAVMEAEEVWKPNKVKEAKSWQVLCGRKSSWSHDGSKRCLGWHGQRFQDAG